MTTLKDDLSFMSDCYMAGITSKAPQRRNHIAIGDKLEITYWTKHLGVSRDRLQSIIEKVGNSAAAVRKELAATREERRSKLI
jgi:hypothetical protein